jgi:TonB family protein
MRLSYGVAVLGVCLVVSGVRRCPAQQTETAETNRKVVTRISPVYPALARTMSLKGNVRMDAVVSPNGTVRSVVLRGGHPVLAQAAQSAIMKWRWEPATHETREPIEVKFDPQ